MATAALLKPNQKVLQAIKDYTVKIDSESISDYPLKATLIYEAMQKYGVSTTVLAEILGKTPETVQAYLDQRIDPNLYITTPSRKYFEIDRAKVERQIRAVKEALNLTYKGGMSDDWYVKDMAIKLADRGLDDLSDFAEKHSEYTIPTGSQLFFDGKQYSLALDSGQTDENGNVSFISYLIDKNEETKVKKIRKTIDGENGKEEIDVYVTTEPITINTGHIGYFNKKNGKEFWLWHPNVWENACEGEGCVNYIVQFTNTGLPVFSTQWYQTGFFADLKPFLPILGIITAAIGLPLIVGDAILGSVGVAGSEALTTAVGRIAVNTALTGGDIGSALTKDIQRSAGGFVGDFAGTAVDSVDIGKIAGAAATAAISGKNPLNAATLAATTLGVKMLGDDTPDFVDTTASDLASVDTTTWFNTNAEFASLTLNDLGIGTDAVSLSDSLAENETILQNYGIDINSVLPDSQGNLFTPDGKFVELDADTYAKSIYVDDQGNVRGPDNEIIIQANDAAQMDANTMTAKIVSDMEAKAGQIQTSVQAPASRPADLPPAAGQTRSPTISDQASTFDKVLKTSVSIGASIKSIANGTFRPTYTTSAFGTPRVQTVGVPIQQSDGSVITNNGNGTQTIRYPNGQTVTTSSSFAGSGIFSGTIGGIPSSTLLIGGGVLLAALLLSRK